ncbi:uncharacterized protein LOC119973603 [Scyliorhinus canicula]|uniref:uncharacterized protein LOC119973603 n=1 Tax=Scyliorhinus canicula TaxID=7830 RepID=UPI0018F48CAB|nr:uncharacterized protein LOC119973603 [Scyliorhinus canicula]
MEFRFSILDGVSVQHGGWRWDCVSTVTSQNHKVHKHFCINESKRNQITNAIYTEGEVYSFTNSAFSDLHSSHFNLKKTLVWNFIPEVGNRSQERFWLSQCSLGENNCKRGIFIARGKVQATDRPAGTGKMLEAATGLPGAKATVGTSSSTFQILDPHHLNRQGQKITWEHLQVPLQVTHHPDLEMHHRSFTLSLGQNPRTPSLTAQWMYLHHMDCSGPRRQLTITFSRGN